MDDHTREMSNINSYFEDIFRTDIYDLTSESREKDTGNRIYTRSRCHAKCPLCVSHHLPVDFGLLHSGERSVRYPAWHQSLCRIFTCSLHLGHHGFLLFLKVKNPHQGRFFDKQGLLCQVTSHYIVCVKYNSGVKF